MKRRFALAMLALLLVACGPVDYGTLPTREMHLVAREKQQAQTSGPVGVQQSEGADQSEVTVQKNTLSIVCIDTRFIKPILSAMEKDFPDLTIDVVTYPLQSGMGNIQKEKYIYQTTTALMSGANIDLVDFSVFPYYKLNMELFFHDLYYYIDADAQLTRESYYQNVLEALEINGHLYGVPANMIYNVVRSNASYKELLDESIFTRDTLDCVTMLTLLNKANEGRETSQSLSCLDNAYTAYAVESPRFYNAKERVVNFADEFTEYIQQIEPWFSQFLFIQDVKGRVRSTHVKRMKKNRRLVKGRGDERC